MLSSILLFLMFVILSAFFSSSETAFIGANPYTLDYLEKKGSKRAGLVKRILSQVDDFLAAILIGNTLSNVAAASLATYVSVSLVRDKETAVLLATAGTTLILLFFSEINPKTYAAHHPLKLSLFLARAVRGLMILLYPFVKAIGFISRRIFPSRKNRPPARSSTISVDETKALLMSGIAGISPLRKNMIAEILEISTRPVKEIMTPRPRIKAIEAGATPQQILETMIAEGFSRLPVYRGRVDHIEGLIHAKDVIPCLVEGREVSLERILRKPYFVPESASVESVLTQMRDNAVHLVFVVDEFGSMEGLVTLEDILEEIVGDIQDEYDSDEEAWFSRLGDEVMIITGAASIKDINKTLGLRLPESGAYSTLAGFFLSEFGRLPREQDVLSFGSYRLTVEKMVKRHISLIRVEAVHG
jgi:putative hemolysin